MPDFAILRTAKLKGGSLASSGAHCDRTRETPNADPTKTHFNIQLVGEGRPSRELVDEVMEEDGILRRKSSVEALEYYLGATPGYFDNVRGEIDRAKLDPWVEENLRFLRDRHGKYLVKAVVHLDEKTPHVSAFAVPAIRGRLNCRELLGDRKKMSALQDEYAERMKPFGLARGVRRSRARHIDLQQFYAAINQKTELEVDPRKITDPPPVLATRKAKDTYKLLVIREVLGQVEESVHALRHQAMLTRDETIKREHAEQFREKAEREAEAATEQCLAERREHATTRGRLEEITAALESAREQNGRLGAEVMKLQAKTPDLPLADVVAALGYDGGRRADGGIAYCDEDGAVVLTIKGQRAHDGEGRVAAVNSIDLVRYTEREWQGEEVTAERAVAFLADEFGPERATAAALFMTEQNLTFYFERRARGDEAPARDGETAPGATGDSVLSRAQEDSRAGVDSEKEEHDGYDFGR